VTAIKTFFTDLRTDEDGASFLEYTVLLGIILAVSIAVLTAVGGYANTIWVALSGLMASAVGRAQQLTQQSFARPGVDRGRATDATIR
jgi:pilus assembly protein Flp/PilA